MNKYITYGYLIWITVLVVLTGCSTRTKDIGGIQPDNNQNKSKSDIRISTQNSVSYTQDEITFLDAVENDDVFNLIDKSFDVEYADTRFQAEKDDPGKFGNPNYDSDFDNSQTLLFQLLCDNYYSRLLYSDSFPFNYRSLIDEGLLIYIPRNPYTGEDVKTSLEYSPGDILIASNNEAMAFLRHIGEKDDGYDSTTNDFNELYYLSGIGKREEIYTDGRTIYDFEKIDSDKLNEAINSAELGRRGYFGDDYTSETARITTISAQVHRMMNNYALAQSHENVLNSLDEYLNYYGRKNPKAWINPYTHADMQQVDFIECQYDVLNDLKLTQPPVPYSIIKNAEQLDNYAGNYSFSVFEDEGGEVAIFAIYYYDKNGDLAASVSRGVPHSRFLQELWEQ
ncbi:hypothetical protein J7L05_06385 [bacterium]|nr:hypothetical protein [bacterium]